MKRMPQVEPAPDIRPDGPPVLMRTAELLQVDTSTLCRWRQAGSARGRRGRRATCRGTSAERLADILLVAGWTGLRWSELRALRVRDFVEVPMPTVVVQRAAPEGVETKTTNSGRSRRAPVADRVLPLVRAMAAGREADAPLFVTSSGHRLHSTAFKRTLGWSTLAADPGWSTLADGRRIHDLRLTAACLWLERGVDPGTVQAWMGHASIATTNLYLHHLGTPADPAGLARLNVWGDAGGTREGAASE